MVQWHAPSVGGALSFGPPAMLDLRPLAGRPPRCDWPPARPVGPRWSGGALLVSEVGGTQHLLIRPVIFMLGCTGRRCSSGDGGQRRGRFTGRRDPGVSPLDLRFVNVGRQAGLATSARCCAGFTLPPGRRLTESLWAGATPGGLLKFRMWVHGVTANGLLEATEQTTSNGQLPFHPVRRGCQGRGGRQEPQYEQPGSSEDLAAAYKAMNIRDDG